MSNRIYERLRKPFTERDKRMIIYTWNCVKEGCADMQSDVESDIVTKLRDGIYRLEIEYEDHLTPQDLLDNLVTVLVARLAGKDIPPLDKLERLNIAHILGIWFVVLDDSPKIIMKCLEEFSPSYSASEKTDFQDCASLVFKGHTFAMSALFRDVLRVKVL